MATIPGVNKWCAENHFQNLHTPERKGTHTHTHTLRKSQSVTLWGITVSSGVTRRLKAKQCPNNQSPSFILKANAKYDITVGEVVISWYDALKPFYGVTCSHSLYLTPIMNAGYFTVEGIEWDNVGGLLLRHLSVQYVWACSRLV